MDNWQQWRKRQRANLIKHREAISKHEYHQWSKTITTSLKTGFPSLNKSCIGLYWPIRGEYDPRPASNYFCRNGATLALPEVINKHKPLCFRKWWQEAPMRSGAYQVPTPDNTEQMTIDTIIIPMLGFDQQGYRLGYGSGYFDRTLATIKPYPLVIGVAFEISRLDSVYPQSHDIQMNFILTEKGIHQVTDNKLIIITNNQCAAIYK